MLCYACYLQTISHNARLLSFDILDNGEVIVTLLPVNEKFPWITPARFRPELVPEELMAPVLTVSGIMLTCL